MRQTALLFILLFLNLAVPPLCWGQATTIQIISSESGQVIQFINDQDLDLDRFQLLTDEAFKSRLERILGLNGYLDARLDSLSVNEEIATAYVNEGCRYSVNDINVDHANEDEVINSTIDDLISRFVDSPFTDEGITNLTTQILTDLERSGYFTAEVSLKSINKQPSSCSVSLAFEIDAGDIIRIQGVRFDGLRENSPSYMRNVAGIRIGDVLTPSNLQSGRQNLINSGFFEEVTEGELVFVNGSPMVLYVVEEQRLNFFDGLIGYQPDAAGSATVAGYADILLRNTLTDETIIDLRYEQLRPLVSTLNLSADQHFIGGLPFQAGVGLNFIQQDSSYLVRDISLQTGYRVLPGLEITASVRAQRSSVTETDETVAAVDSRANFLGVGFHLRNTNRYWVPTQGIVSRVLLERGRRFINSDGVDSEEGRSFTQTILTSSVRGFLPLGSRQILVPYVSASFLESPVFLATDLFRFGGAESLRGFREDQFRASSVVWGELEGRYMLEANSYLFLFGSMARYSRPELITEQNDQLAITETLSSLGFGLAFQSPLGIIKFSYAVSPNENLSNGNVHVGIRAGI